jgi:hypothetical protein
VDYPAISLHVDSKHAAVSVSVITHGVICLFYGLTIAT